jgi:ABC-type Fe3+ transport system substrate-binding protein
MGLAPVAPFKISHPIEGKFVTWPQTAAILKDAPHPESAKLLHNYVLSQEWQNQTRSWSVRQDFPAPAGFSDIENQPGTNASSFAEWMGDRARVERFRFWLESKLGTAQGLSPLVDDL